MSGHSKWSTIKRQKGAQDAKRGQIFTKLSNAITIAVKQSGGITDPERNFKLRLTVDRAKRVNMPKENIARAIERAGVAAGGIVEELLYEGFAHGAALIVEAVTDNKQRTIADVKNLFEKNGGSLGSSGSVSYLFKRRGEITIKKNEFDSEELLNKGINANVEDMEEEQGLVFYYVNTDKLAEVKKNLELEGLTVDNTRLTYIPINYIVLDTAKQKQVLSLVESLEALDDVQEVYANILLG